MVVDLGDMGELGLKWTASRGGGLSELRSREGWLEPHNRHQQNKVYNYKQKEL